MENLLKYQKKRQKISCTRNEIKQLVGVIVKYPEVETVKLWLLLELEALLLTAAQGAEGGDENGGNPIDGPTGLNEGDPNGILPLL